MVNLYMYKGIHINVFFLFERNLCKQVCIFHSFFLCMLVIEMYEDNALWVGLTHMFSLIALYVHFFFKKKNTTDV